MLTALLFAAGSCVLAIPPLSHLSAIQTCEKHDLACGIDPGDDFYAFVNKRWEDSAVIPDSEVQVGSFLTVHLENEEKISKIVSDIVEKSAAGSKDYVTNLIADLYTSGMDQDAIESSTSDLVKAYLAEIDGITTVTEAVRIAWAQKTRGLNGAFFYDLQADADLHNSSHSFGMLATGGISLPKSYYLEEQNRQVLQAYTAYLRKLFLISRSASADNVDGMVERVLWFETELAKVALTPVEERNISLTSTKYMYSELPSRFPGIPWDTIRKQESKMSAEEIGPVRVDCLRCFDRLGSLLETTPLPTIISYVKANFLMAAADDLGYEYEEAVFQWNQAYSGIKEAKPRWKKVLAKLNSYVGQPLGKLYVEKYFAPEQKADVIAMVDLLLKTIRGRISGAKWMSDGTRAKAHAKLDKMNVKMGYPDQWDDYTPLKELISKDMPFIEKLAAIHSWKTQRKMTEKINKAYNKEQWHMTPQTVNAYYSPDQNEIVFPAGFLSRKQ
ncbi:MAG: hypothetical protein SGCHY_001424 [Lobulomycetales sp.]